MEYLANLRSSPGSEALPLKTPFLLLFPVKVRLLDIKQMLVCGLWGRGAGGRFVHALLRPGSSSQPRDAGIVALPSKDPCGKAG